MLTNKVVMRLKGLFLTTLCLFCVLTSAFSQSANAVYLKDGSRIIGHVLQLDSVGAVSIMTMDGQRKPYVGHNSYDGNRRVYAVSGRF